MDVSNGVNRGDTAAKFRLFSRGLIPRGNVTGFIGMLKAKVLKWVDPFLRLPAVGLDISDLTVKYLKFNSRGEKIRFDFWGEFNLPEGLVKAGEIENEAGLIQTLKSWLDQEGKKLLSYFAVVSLPEEKSFLRLIQLPKVKRDEVVNAVRWEIEANIPLPPEALVYDYEVIEPLEDHLDHLDVVITAFPKGIVESYLRVLKAIGFKVSYLELESQAIVRSAVFELRQKGAQILVDIGRSRTSFIIVAGGAIIFTATVKLGGQDLEKNIAKSLSVSMSQAFNLKEEVGLNKITEGGKVYSALLPTVLLLAEELKKIVVYYQDHVLHTHGGSRTIENILLLGGDANLFGLDTFFSSFLKIPVSRTDPFAAIKSRLETFIPPIPKNKALKFSTASGLALRGLLRC